MTFNRVVPERHSSAGFLETGTPPSYVSVLQSTSTHFISVCIERLVISGVYPLGAIVTAISRVEEPLQKLILHFISNYTISVSLFTKLDLCSVCSARPQISILKLMPARRITSLLSVS